MASRCSAIVNYPHPPPALSAILSGGPSAYSGPDTTMTHLDNLITRWRSEASFIRSRYNDEPRARVCEVCADELEEAIREAAGQPLTLAQAAHMSGYSKDHISRLIRDGKITNAGRKGSPRVLVRDLPRKPGLRPEPPRLHLTKAGKESVARSVLSPIGG